MAKATKGPKVRRMVSRKVAELIPYARNARTHSDDQVADIAASIKAFGWVQPVVIGDDGEIIAGHGRIMAARLLKLEAVPCIVVNDLSEAEKRALRLVDNKVALNADWNKELLALEVADLKDLGSDLIGFSSRELSKLASVEVGAAGGNRSPIRQMSFKLTEAQIATIKKAIEKAKGAGAFGNTGNENAAGNALARICEAYLGTKARGQERKRGTRAHPKADAA